MDLEVYNIVALRSCGLKLRMPTFGIWVRNLLPTKRRTCDQWSSCFFYRSGDRPMTNSSPTVLMCLSTRDWPLVSYLYGNLFFPTYTEKYQWLKDIFPYRSGVRPMTTSPHTTFLGGGSLRVSNLCGNLLFPASAEKYLWPKEICFLPLWRQTY
jgi:hypothetical protein